MIDNYHDLSFGDYMKIDAILDTEESEVEKQVQIIAILAGIPEDTLLNMPLPEYAALSAKTAFLRSKHPDVKVPKKLIVRGQTYRPTLDFKKLTTAQYVDFQAMSRRGKDGWVDLLTVLLIPEGHKYNDGYDIAEVRDAAEAMPMPVAMAMLAFFLKRSAESMQAFLTSLERTAKQVETSPATREILTNQIARMRAALRGLGLLA